MPECINAMRQDEELSGKAFYENVLDACRIDGKMLFVMPSFSVIGLMGKKSDFGDTKGVTIEQLEKMIRDKGVSYDTALGVMSRDSILSWVMYLAMQQYVDWDAGTCSFDSDSFTGLLEFAAKFPKSIDYDNIDWEKREADMREGKQIVRECYMYDFNNYMTERYGYIGEEVSFMGYPGDGTRGPVLMDDMEFAISHTARDPEGCWSFLRTFYLDDYQNSIEYAFPVNKEALQAKAEEALHPRTYSYTDENGETVEEVSHSNVYLNGKTIEIPTPEQADIDAVMQVLESVDEKSSLDQNISSIIREEADAFFEGQKSADEVAKIIQSRAQVYINETK